MKKSNINFYINRSSLLFTTTRNFAVYRYLTPIFNLVLNRVHGNIFKSIVAPFLNPVFAYAQPYRQKTRNICISPSDKVILQNKAKTVPLFTALPGDSDLKFNSWFAGFCDAEGNFQTTNFKRVNKKGTITSIGLKYSFHIGLHLRDKILLEFIQTKLNNMGKIYEYPKKEEAHLAIYKIDDLKWLIEHIFSKYPLLSDHQAIRYEQLRIGITNNLKRLDSLDNLHTILIDKEKFITPLQCVHTKCSDLTIVKDLNSEYIKNWTCGFLNGEVSFTNGKNNNIKFPKINLEHTDEKVIKLVKITLSLELNIYTRTRDSRKTTYSISISSKKDIQNTVKFLDSLNNFRGYKLKQYNDWKEEFNLIII